MKRLLVFLMAMVLTAGCGNSGGETEETLVETPVETTEGKDSGQDAEEKGTAEASEQKAESSMEGGNVKASSVNIKIFVPDDNAEGFVEKEVQIPENNQQEIWQVLVSEGLIPEGCGLLSFSQEGNTLKMDVNKAFGEALRSTGTTGETMMMGSVVNTFLGIYACDGVLITEEGDVLRSGHREYGEVLTRF